MCIIWYAQILGAIFFGTFWISTNREAAEREDANPSNIEL